jgi:hypothetical protein
MAPPAGAGGEKFGKVADLPVRFLLAGGAVLKVRRGPQRDGAAKGTNFFNKKNDPQVKTPVCSF